MAFFKYFFRNNRIYLDYASSTPVDRKMISLFPRVPDSVLAANPSALHSEGVALSRLLRTARERVARVLHAHADEIIFTSSATESDNLALSGTIATLRAQGVGYDEIMITISALEHSAVSETVAVLVAQGVSVHILDTEEGVINPKDISVPAGIKTMIVSVMYVSNEIGTVQPIVDIAKRIRFLRKENPTVRIIFHTDATQAPLHFTLNVAKLGIDMMTLGATKLYTPKGVGVLYVRRGTPIVSSMYGGGQEYRLRPGTQPVDLIVQFAYALEYAQTQVPVYTEKTRALQNYFETEVIKAIEGVRITGSTQERTPHISHIAIQGFDSELLVIELDARGIAVSSKSACKNEDSEESSFVEKMYGKGWGAVRFSFGRTTTVHDIDRAIKALSSVVKKYRSL